MGYKNIIQSFAKLGLKTFLRLAYCHIMQETTSSLKNVELSVFTDRYAVPRFAIGAGKKMESVFKTGSGTSRRCHKRLTSFDRLCCAEFFRTLT